MSPDRSMASANPANPQTWNRYTYAGNDPINFIDPSGQQCITLDDGTVVDDDTEPLCDDPDFDQSTTNVNVTIRPDPNNAEFLWYWLTGQLPDHIFYGQNDPATQDMARSDAVLKDRQDYINKGCPATGPLNAENLEAYRETFGPKFWVPVPGVASVPIPGFLVNPTQAQVGGFGGKTSQITRNSNGTITYTITNTAGVSSLLGLSAAGGLLSRAGININRNAWDNPFGASGKAHNVVQTFQWSEPNPCR